MLRQGGVTHRIGGCGPYVLPSLGASSLTGGQSALASEGRQETQLTSGETEQQLAEVTGSCPQSHFVI